MLGKFPRDTLLIKLIYSCDGNARREQISNTVVANLTLKDAGGGPKVPSGFSIGCHFSQDPAMVTKILDFIHIHPK